MCKQPFREQRLPRAILGIDPGSRVTGYAAIEQRGRKMTVIESGTIILRAEEDLSARLGVLQQRLEEVLDRVEPTEVAVEDIFTAHNARSALLLGQARGAVLAALGRRGLLVAAYAPAMVKRAVSGNGRATKHQVQRMVQVLLGLSRVPCSDEADALAVAICHGMSRRPSSRQHGEGSARR